MLLKVLLPGKVEGLFNADCLTAALLDSIKKQHSLPRNETIDLCTADGQVKDLHRHLTANAQTYFKPRELCLVVRIHTTEDGHEIFTPVLPNYASNQEFVAMVNHRTAQDMCVRVHTKDRPLSYKAYALAHKKAMERPKGKKNRQTSSRKH